MQKHFKAAKKKKVEEEALTNVRFITANTQDYKTIFALKNP